MASTSPHNSSVRLKTKPSLPTTIAPIASDVSTKAANAFSIVSIRVLLFLSPVPGITQHSKAASEE
jgi:hypothetical protein